MKVPDGLRGMTDEEVKECTDIIDDISPTDLTESAYECIEVIDDLIQTMVEMHDKEIPIPYKMYQDAVQLKYDMVVSIISFKQESKCFLKEKED